MQRSQQPKLNSAFVIDSSGHYVSRKDGFIVPKNFSEFYERFPNYVTSWVHKHIQNSYRRNTADVQDWVSDLTLHLMVLPERSLKRKNGFVDVISCFDPTRLGGANSKSFFYYVNTCLKNHFVEHLHKNRKDAIRDVLRHSPNLSFDEIPAHAEDEQKDPICDQGRTNQDIYMTVRVGEFRAYVEKNEPELLPVVDIIFDTDTLKETANKLSLTVYQFRSVRSRLKVLYECFEKGLSAPKRRNRHRKQRAESRQVCRDLPGLPGGVGESNYWLVLTLMLVCSKAVAGFVFD
jgi:hypothetical protein